MTEGCCITKTNVSTKSKKKQRCQWFCQMFIYNVWFWFWFWLTSFSTCSTLSAHLFDICSLTCWNSSGQKRCSWDTFKDRGQTRPETNLFHVECIMITLTSWILHCDWLFRVSTSLWALCLFCLSCRSCMTASARLFSTCEWKETRRKTSWEKCSFVSLGRDSKNTIRSEVKKLNSNASSDSFCILTPHRI